MANPLILIPKLKWSPLEILKSFKHAGRPKRKLPGGWVDDLASLKKCILLCSSCAHRFNDKKAGYFNVARWEKYFAAGSCDDCRQFSRQLRLYIYEPHVNKCIVTNDAERTAKRRAAIVGGC